MKTENEIPRRNRLDLNTPAEISIHAAIQEVEKAGADERLTEAVVLLGKAKELVADFVDGIPMKSKFNNEAYQGWSYGE